MESEAPPVADPDKPKSKLAPLTEWRTPPPAAYVPPPETEPVSPRRNDLIIGVAIALIAAGAGANWLLSAHGGGDVSGPLPAAEQRKADERRRLLVANYDPVSLPSGVPVDRSSTMNYDLAAWLAPSPQVERVFTFDRIGFARGSAALGDDAGETLQVLSQILNAYPQARARIIGNGPGPLGLARAEAIRAAMLRLGADPAQLAIEAGNASENAPKLAVKLEMGVESDLDA